MGLVPRIILEAIPTVQPSRPLCMETCEVKILNYVFRFRRLYWKDEFAIKFQNRDPYRTLLSHALLEVSGLPVTSAEEAEKVVAALPYAIMERVFRVWKGSFPPSRRFVTGGLYKAPDPIQYQAQVDAEETKRDKVTDSVVQRLQSQFGEQEVAEAKELSDQILKASNMRGAIKATSDA